MKKDTKAKPEISRTKQAHTDAKKNSQKHTKTCMNINIYMQIHINKHMRAHT